MKMFIILKKKNSPLSKINCGNVNSREFNQVNISQAKYWRNAFRSYDNGNLR